MRFDTIIIGGGLSGLTCGISLLKKNRRVAIFAGGQSTLHFGSGSFDLLGFDNQGREVNNPLQTIPTLNDKHPYAKIESCQLEALATSATALLNEAGLKVSGSASKNHYRLTPLGVLKPTWLTMNGFLTADSGKQLPWKKVLLINYKGFLDFPTHFIKAGIERMGAQCLIQEVSIPELNLVRKSPSEMRAPRIAHTLSQPGTIEQLAKAIRQEEKDCEAVLVPDTLGLNGDNDFTQLSQTLDIPCRMVATLPPSVSGIRTQVSLRRLFTQLGGNFLLGSNVKAGSIRQDKVESIAVGNLPDQQIEAENYVLATGSFMSQGLHSDYNHIYEPIFGLDVDAAANREEWTSASMFAPQPYMEFGVKTDTQLHALKDGRPVSNLYAIGSLLCGHNHCAMADRAGTDMLTALQAANHIYNESQG